MNRSSQLIEVDLLVWRLPDEEVRGGICEEGRGSEQRPEVFQVLCAVSVAGLDRYTYSTADRDRRILAAFDACSLPPVPLSDSEDEEGPSGEEP